MAGAIGMIGMGIQLVSGVMGAQAQADMVNRQAAASTRAENAREQQMRLDSHRQRRQAVREGLLARSMSLTAGVSQGAQYGSGVAAGLGQATSGAAQNVQAISSNEVTGGRIFQANRDYFRATAEGQSAVAMWQGIGSIGGALANNAGAIGRIGGQAPGAPNYAGPYGGFGRQRA